MTFKVKNVSKDFHNMVSSPGKSSNMSRQSKISPSLYIREQGESNNIYTKLNCQYESDQTTIQKPTNIPLTSQACCQKQRKKEEINSIWTKAGQVEPRSIRNPKHRRI